MKWCETNKGMSIIPPPPTPYTYIMCTYWYIFRHIYLSFTKATKIYYQKKGSMKIFINEGRSMRIKRISKTLYFISFGLFFFPFILKFIYKQLTIIRYRYRNYRKKL